jgi:hypothetical protein
MDGIKNKIIEDNEHENGDNINHTYLLPKKIEDIKYNSDVKEIRINNVKKSFF